MTLRSGSNLGEAVLGCVGSVGMDDGIAVGAPALEARRGRVGREESGLGLGVEGVCVEPVEDLADEPEGDVASSEVEGEVLDGVV